MKRSKKRRNHQKIANNYLGMAAIAIVVLILLVGLTMQSNNLKARIAVYDAKAEISWVSSKETRSFLKKRSNIRNKADFAEKFFLTAAFV